jgi:LPXTG-motif cell wall-anchored protein
VSDAARTRRLALVDALRGLAIAQMIVFHFVYTLEQFDLTEIAVHRDAPWLAWRTAIVSQFLLLVGVSQTLRAGRGRAFGRRWAEVAGAAAIVSFGSWLVFAERMIWLGILHFIALALLLAQPLLRLGAWNLALGLGALALPRLVVLPAGPLALVLGLAPELPHTEDYVPLFPWLGVVLIGLGLGALWRRRGFALAPPFAALDAAAPRALVRLGTWPLTIYLAHEPVLAGIVWCGARLFGAG